MVVNILVVFLFAGGYALLEDVEPLNFPDGVHPSLYFSGAQTQEMRLKASTTHEKIARDIKEAGLALNANPDRYLPPVNYTKFASRWNEVFGNNLCAFAMYSFLYPDDKLTFRHVKTFMDRMASYPDWYVAASYKTDQVPVGHSLTGFSTGYDLLYDVLDFRRRKLYYETIKKTSEDLYELLKKKRFGWTKQYTHNHAASNIVALLLGSLVVSVHEPDIADPWIALSKKHLDVTMLMLSHVTDGSMDEGVSYGSYTSRGITQYVYLAKKHLNTDHTENPWLKQHFWFYYKTILPGFQRSVGIADSNHNWFFGPGSQLVFLDNYVMKNGYGNWLAGKIRRARPKNKPLAASSAQAWSMLHTEYIFFNASLRPQKPTQCYGKNIHFYSDWGVVTYGGGQDMKTGNTFLSFKSGIPNGESAIDITYNNRYPEYIEEPWKNWNPGHEHPDHNSFVFAPNGRYFITEALYGPKFSFLDNVVVFSPSSTSGCNQPWEGQLGECDKWLKYKLFFNQDTRGDVITASTSSNGMIFIAGEASAIYSKSLQLSSVYRGVMLLNPEILIVVDSIKLMPGSKTKIGSSLFHNMLHKFKEYVHLGYQGAQVQYPEGEYSMFSLKVGDKDINTTLHSGVQPIGLREGPTNFINVTYSLTREVTNIIHIFSGPNYFVKSVTVSPKSGSRGIVLVLNINNTEYIASISTTVKARSKKSSPVKERKAMTGFGGYASVRMGSEVYYLGLNDRILKDPSSVEHEVHRLSQYSSTPIEASTPVISKFTLSLTEGCSIILNEIIAKSTENVNNWFWISTESTNLILAFPFVLLVLCIFVVVFKKEFTLRKIRKSDTKTRVGVMSLSFLIILNLLCIDKNGTNTCFDAWRSRNVKRRIDTALHSRVNIPSSPFVFITSLPGSGSDLLRYLFEDQNEFLPISSPVDVTIPVNSHNVNQPNLCLWNSLQNQFNFFTMGWFTSLRTKTILHFNQQLESKFVLKIREQLRRNFNPTIVLDDDSGFWVTKLPWVRNVIGKEDFQPILVVRDPRSWISTILHDSLITRREKMINSLTGVYHQIGKSCDDGGSDYPHYYWHFKQFEATRKSDLDTVEELAVIWTISIANALSNENSEGQWPLHIVRFEDVVNKTEITATDIFTKLGLPLKLKHMNKLTRVVRSQYFSVPFDDVIRPITPDLWKSQLSESNIRKIVEICCPLMKILKYDC